MKIRSLSCFGGLLTASLLIPGVIVADEMPGGPETQPTPTAVTAKDIERFGRIPCRYNGRLTTFAGYANTELRDISGRDFAENGAGERLRGTRWLLDLATGKNPTGDLRLLSTTVPVQRRFEFPPREPNAFGRAWYSAKEVPVEKLQKRLEDLADRPDDERTPVDVELHRLARCFRRLNVVNSSFAQLLQPGATAREVIGRIEVVEREPILRPVPAMRGTPWIPFVRAALLHQLQPKEETRPVAGFFEILAAYEADDGPRFRRAVEAYGEVLKQHGFASAPFDYDVPDGWFELGRPYSLEPVYYSDAMQNGLHVTSIETRRGDEILGIDVNVFDGEFPPARRFSNDWRIDHGLVPLPPARAERHLRPIEVGEFSGFLVDVATPEGAPDPRTRSMGAILQRGKLSFLVTMNGPLDLAEGHSQTFESFVESLEFGSEEQLAEWFGDVGAFPNESTKPFAGLIAMLPDRDGVWVCELIDLDEIVRERRTPFLSFVDSLRVVDDAPLAERLRYEVPETWTRREGTGTHASFWTSKEHSKGPASAVSIVWVRREEGDAFPLPYVNHWLESCRGEPIDAARLAELSSSRRVGDRAATLVEFKTERPKSASDPR